MPSIPRKMLAAVLHGPNDVRLEEVETPTPGEGEVLCRVKSIGICGTDVPLIAGRFQGMWPPSYPFIAGHEWAGEVVAVGPDVWNFRVGDRVAAESHKGCGFCAMCLKGRYNLCYNYGRHQTGHRQYGFTAPGAYAEYCAISTKAIHSLPPHIPYDVGATVDVVAISMSGVRRGRVGPGDTAAIIGPGPIGLSALVSARAAGASRLIMVGRSAQRLMLAREMGADETVDASREDPISRVRELTGGLGADVVLECSGNPEAVKQSFSMVGKGGRVVLVGITRQAEAAVPVDKVVLEDLEVVGVRAHANISEDVIRLMATGRLDVAPMITHRFPLGEFHKALETFARRLGGAVKVIINP